MEINIVFLGTNPVWLDVSILKSTLSNSRYWKFSFISHLENFSNSHFGIFLSKTRKLGDLEITIQERHQKVLDYFIPFAKGKSSKFIFITKKHLPLSFFSINNGKNISIISYNNWKTLYENVPLEIVFIKEILTASLLFSRTSSDKRVFHKETKGCLYDFCEYKQELKAGLWGYICGDCQSYLKSTNVSQLKQDEVKSLIRLAISKTISESEVLHMLKSIRIFISHGKEDKIKVKKLYEFLISEGFNAWLDENEILPGDHWKDVIENAINDAEFVLLCMSSKTVSKFGYFQKEIKKAQELQEYHPVHSAFIIPVRFDEFEIPDMLKDIQYTDLFPEWKTQAAKLVKGIKKQYHNRLNRSQN